MCLIRACKLKMGGGGGGGKIQQTKDIIVRFIQNDLKDIKKSKSIKHPVVKINLFEPVCEKTNNFGSDLFRHKPGCTVTEDG